MKLLRKLHPEVAFWIVTVAMTLALNSLDILAAHVFSWHRPSWLDFLASAAYGGFAVLVAIHCKDLIRRGRQNGHTRHNGPSDQPSEPA